MPDVINGEILLKGGDRIVDQHFKMGSGKRILCLMGSDILIERCTFDFNFDVWKPFATCIRSKHRNVHIPLNDIRIVNNSFFNTGSAVHPGGNGDAWAINLNNHSGLCRNLQIIGNRVVGQHQLTAGGGLGWSDVEIAYNRLHGGKSNGIAISSRSKDSEAFFRNIYIHHNVIDDCTHNGIFVGVDGKPKNKSVALRDIFIHDNKIRLTDTGEVAPFPDGVLVKGTDSFSDGIHIDRNQFFNRVGRSGFRPISVKGFDSGDCWASWNSVIGGMDKAAVRGFSLIEYQNNFLIQQE